MRVTTESELAMLGADRVVILCRRHPALAVRLKSFRKAGLRFSSKANRSGLATRGARDLAAAVEAAGASSQASPRAVKKLPVAAVVAPLGLISTDSVSATASAAAELLAACDGDKCAAMAAILAHV